MADLALWLVRQDAEAQDLAREAMLSDRSLLREPSRPATHARPTGRVLPMLQCRLQSLESFRKDGLRKELLRRALAMALAVRWLPTRSAAGRNQWTDAARNGDVWLQRAPLGATVWLDAVARSKLLEFLGVALALAAVDPTRESQAHGAVRRAAAPRRSLAWRRRG